MKKIINGKMYNTETATEVGDWCSYLGITDFGYYEETLYKKRTGEYFLYGSGNAGSKYSESCGTNTWCGSERITPLTVDEAKAWAEDHLDTDEYIDIFGEVEE